MSGETVFFVSDTHLGDGTAADRFLYAGQLTELLGKIESHHAAHLVLLGDFLELWACSLEATMVRHANIFSLIARISNKHKVTYVVGNHDCLPWYYFLNGRLGNIAVVERLSLQRGGLMALHGHQFDPFNKVKAEPGGKIQIPWTRKLVEAIGAVERIGGEPAAAAISDAGELLSAAAETVAGIFARESPGERGYPSAEAIYDDAARGLMRSGARWVLMGHTHHPLRRTYGPRVYVNTGSWVWNRYPPTYGLFDGDTLHLMDAISHQPYKE